MSDADRIAELERRMHSVEARLGIHRPPRGAPHWRPDRGMRVAELEHLASSGPLWSKVPPDKTDDSTLRAYLDNGLIEWVGNGYVITKLGRQTIAIVRGAAHV
jgi:hypothetical protein